MTEYSPTSSPVEPENGDRSKHGEMLTNAAVVGFQILPWQEYAPTFGPVWTMTC